MEKDNLYENAILFDSILFFEANLTKDLIEEEVHFNPEKANLLVSPSELGFSLPFKFSDLCSAIAKYFSKRKLLEIEDLFSNARERLVKRFENGEKEFSIEYWVEDNNNEKIYVNEKFIFQKNDDGDLCVLVIIRDYSKIQKVFEENHRLEMEQCAYYDPVTKGYNYFKFKQLLNQLTISGFIVVIDIHSFKIINSVCGIPKGDAVIKKIWEVVCSTLDFDSNELASHINADHFIIFYPTYDSEEIIEKIKELTVLITEVSGQMHVPNIKPYFGVSEWHPGKKVELSNSEAVAAKHVAKNQSEENYAFFDRKDNIKLIKEKKITDAFSDALKNGEFKVWFQPKYNPLSKRMVGAEALIRWQKEDGSMMSPISFIPIFEQNGMIRELDEYVFTTVCKLQKKWQKEGKKIVPVSVNISRASLYSKDVVLNYKRISEEVGIKSKYVPIEITETAAVDDEKIKDIANNFYLNGFPLHMDDFGSGYSTLSSLNILPFETLKLDKSLIDYIGNFGGDRLIEHTICLAKELGMQVTAEGVENENQEKFLKHTGVDSIQGYFYSKPIPQQEFETKLDNFCELPQHKTMDLVAEHIIEYRKSFIKSSLYTFLANLTQNYVNQDSGSCDWIGNSEKFGSYDEIVRNVAENYVVDEDKDAYKQFLCRENILKNFCGKEETRIFHYKRFLNKNPTKMRLMINVFTVKDSEEIWAYVTVTQL